jgi:hypothetical protein
MGSGYRATRASELHHAHHPVSRSSRRRVSNFCARLSEFQSGCKRVDCVFGAFGNPTNIYSNCRQCLRLDNYVFLFRDTIHSFDHTSIIIFSVNYTRHTYLGPCNFDQRLATIFIEYSYNIYYIDVCLIIFYWCLIL